MVNEEKIAEVSQEDENIEEKTKDDSADKQKAQDEPEQTKEENDDESKPVKNGAEKTSVNSQNEKLKGKNIPDNIKGEVLHVSNISPETIAFDLELLFSKFGKIGYIRMLKTVSGRPYAFVNLESGDAKKCVVALNNTFLKGSLISVAFSKSSPGFDSGKQIHTLSVTGIPRFYKVSQFKELFADHGDVLKVKTIKSPASRTHYTLVTIESADISKCIKELDKTKVEGKEISISQYTGPNDQHPPYNDYNRPEPFIRPHQPILNDPFKRAPLLQNPFTNVPKSEILDPLLQRRRAELELKAEYQKMQEERELLKLEREFLMREKLHHEEMRKEALRLEQLRKQMKQEKEELEQFYHSRPYSSVGSSQRASAQSFMRNDDKAPLSNRLKRPHSSSLPYTAKRNR